MSEDWFQFVELMNGRMWLEGWQTDKSEVGRWLTADEAKQVERLRAAQDAAMARLLRALAKNTDAGGEV